MFKAGLPGLPRLITALAQWLGVTVMIFYIRNVVVWNNDSGTEFCNCNLVAEKYR